MATNVWLEQVGLLKRTTIRTATFSITDIGIGDTS